MPTYTSSTDSPLPIANPHLAILDSGCSHHFIQSSTPTTTTQPDTTIEVQLPDGSNITSSHSTTIQLHPTLSPEAQHAFVLPDLQHSLLSISQLCDHGCTAHFTKDNVSIQSNNKTIITGHRSPTTKLWHIPIPTPNTNSLQYINSAFRPNTTIKERIAYYHACCFSPALSTWCTAIDAGHFTTWPELTSQLVRQYAPASIAMHKGHLDQTRRNQRSTKTNPNTALTTIHKDNITNTESTPDTSDSIRSHHIFASCEPITGKIASDPTGRFIIPSSNGNAYILVVYDYDSNMIFAEPMKSRSGPDHLAAYKNIHALLTSRGLRPQLQRLDNEASTQLKTFLSDNQVDFQLVPPHAHRRNSAERAIRVFKNHFIAGLCSTDPSFPLHLWDRLLPQALLTLNLLRSSHINPKLSAQALIHGSFDFNRTPLAPPGTKVLIHTKPNTRETWAPHGAEGWYLGPAMNHYRCYRVYANETRAERIADTLAWFPSETKMPSASSTDAAIAAANDLITALQNPHPASALSPLADNEHAALQQLAEIFRNRTDPSTIPVPPGFEPLPPVPDTTSNTATEPRVVPTNPPTYIQSTINPARRRRLQRQQQKTRQLTTTSTVPTLPSPAPTLPTTNTTYTNPKQKTPPKDNPTTQLPRHNHNTRYRALSLAAGHLFTQSLFPKDVTTRHHAYAVTDP